MVTWLRVTTELNGGCSSKPPVLSSPFPVVYESLMSTNKRVGFQYHSNWLGYVL